MSYSNLANKIRASVDTVTRWIRTLESLYYCFTIRPWSKNITRSLLKEPKVYLWNWAEIKDEGARFENLVACHLLKMTHALEDQEGYKVRLHYLRDAGKREVDFLVTADKKPWFAVECKTSDRAVNPALNYFGKRLKIPYLYQITFDGGEDILDGRVRVMPAAKFLAALP